MEHIKRELRKRLTKNRYEHVIRVTNLAVQLAEKYEVDVDDVKKASLLHDVAKCMDKETLRTYIIHSGNHLELLNEHHELWHGPVGALIAESEFAITNEQILNAIRFHTTGRAGMSPLEKIVYVADLLEAGRSFPGIDLLRREAELSLDRAMQKCIIHTIQYLMKKRVKINENTFHCYNDLISNERKL